jgi:hypothetical protein
MIKRTVTLIVMVPLILWAGLTFDRHRVAKKPPRGLSAGGNP